MNKKNALAKMIIAGVSLVVIFIGEFFLEEDIYVNFINIMIIILYTSIVFKSSLYFYQEKNISELLNVILGIFIIILSAMNIIK